jgi:hypothetical protein
MHLSFEIVFFFALFGAVVIAAVRSYANAVAEKVASTSLLTLFVGIARRDNRRLWFEVHAICEVDLITDKRTKKRSPGTIVSGIVFKPWVYDRGTEVLITVVEAESCTLFLRDKWQFSERKSVDRVSFEGQDISWVSLEEPQDPLACLHEEMESASIYRCHWQAKKGPAVDCDPKLLKFLAAATMDVRA